MVPNEPESKTHSTLRSTKNLSQKQITSPSRAKSSSVHSHNHEFQHPDATNPQRLELTDQNSPQKEPFTGGTLQPHRHRLQAITKSSSSHSTPQNKNSKQTNQLTQNLTPQQNAQKENETTTWLQQSNEPRIHQHSLHIPTAAQTHQHRITTP